jgi:hypothetical protein
MRHVVVILIGATAITGCGIRSSSNMDSREGKAE